MSISALGSVKGKKLGRKRSIKSSLSKNLRQKPVKMTFRSLKLTFSPIHRPSHWWNIGECGVAVDAVGAARGDHADLGHGLARIQRRAMRFDMLHRVAYLHRAGVR